MQADFWSLSGTKTFVLVCDRKKKFRELSCWINYSYFYILKYQNLYFVFILLNKTWKSFLPILCFSFYFKKTTAKLLFRFEKCIQSCYTAGVEMHRCEEEQSGLFLRYTEHSGRQYWGPGVNFILFYNFPKVCPTFCVFPMYWEAIKKTFPFFVHIS